MQVNIKQAIRLFFSNPSLDMVFIEAIANSLDADASKINICISIEELGKQETLKIFVLLTFLTAILKTYRLRKWALW